MHCTISPPPDTLTTAEVNTFLPLPSLKAPKTDQCFFFFLLCICKEALQFNIAILLVLPGGHGTEQHYDLGNYDITADIIHSDRTEKRLRRIVQPKTAMNEFTERSRMMSEQWKLVQQAMGCMEDKMRVYATDNMPVHKRPRHIANGHGTYVARPPSSEATPSVCQVCAKNTMYEGTAATSIVKVDGMKEWMQQWENLMGAMVRIENKMRTFIVPPPRDINGPWQSTCKSCAGCATDEEDNAEHDD